MDTAPERLLTLFAFSSAGEDDVDEEDMDGVDEDEEEEEEEEEVEERRKDSADSIWFVDSCFLPGVSNALHSEYARRCIVYKGLVFSLSVTSLRLRNCAHLPSRKERSYFFLPLLNITVRSRRSRRNVGQTRRRRVLNAAGLGRV